jgi:hypothetical protein
MLGCRELRLRKPAILTSILHWRGAIAQLGERLLCKQEVVGSIPSGSTRRRCSFDAVQLTLCFALVRENINPHALAFGRRA